MGRIDRISRPPNEDLSAKTGSTEEAGEPDRRGGERPLEAYAPSLVGRNSVRVSVRYSYVSIEVLKVLVSTNCQGLCKTAL